MVCGVKTNIVTAVELTMTNEHDTKFLPELGRRLLRILTSKRSQAIKRILPEPIWN
jgi:hypothetical protein